MDRILGFETPRSLTPFASSVPDLHRLFESLPELYLVLAPDRHFEILAASDAYLEATLTQREKIVGRRLFDVLLELSGNRDEAETRKLRASLFRVLRKKTSDRMPPRRNVFRRTDGRSEERFWIPVNSAVRDPNGNIAYLVHRLEDATERVHLQSTLTDLRAARDRSQRTLELTDEFLSLASHELKTPLTPLKLRTQSILRLLGTGAFRNHPQEKHLAAYFESASRQCDRMNRLVDNMLDVARIQGGKLTLVRDTGDLVELVERIVAQYGPEFDRFGCEIRVRGVRPVIGAWDSNRLEQVLLNLLSNAVKFGPGKPVEVGISRDRGLAKISVKDYGIGIEPADQSKIFRRFERAAAARDYGGLGLGLYVARKIVRAHGGTIGVQSRPGHGSEFIVRMPIRTRTEPRVSPWAKPHSPTEILRSC